MQHLLQNNFITNKLGVTLSCETFKMCPLREISISDLTRYRKCYNDDKMNKCLNKIWKMI